MGDDLKDRILKCIDKGLSRVGDIKAVIYWHSENEYGLPKDLIPERPDKFVKLLKEIYGQGAEIISFNIVKELEMEFRLRNLPNELDKAVKVVKEITIEPEEKPPEKPTESKNV